MANLYRLGAAVLLALCAAMIWTPAHASFPANTSWLASWYTTTSNPQLTGQAACSEVGQMRMDYSATASPANSPWVLNSAVYVAPSSCSFNYSNKYATNVNDSGSAWTTGTCPTNSTLSGGQCTCNPGTNQVGSTCVDPAPCDWAVGKQELVFGSFSIALSNPTVCNSGCRFVLQDPTFVPSYTWRKDAASPWQGEYTMGNFVGTNQVCTGNEGEATGSPTPTVAPPAAPPEAPKSECPSGQIPGTYTINGITTTLCNPPMETTSKKENQTVEQTPEGPKTTTIGETTQCNAAGSCATTTTTSVSVNGGSPTITTSTETADKQTYCASSKGAGKKECGTGAGSWAGDCAAGFKGDGDPVMVAVALEIHVQNCKLNAASDESALYEAEKAKTGNRTNDLPGNQNVNVSSANFDQSNALGVGAACIGDKSIVVMGASISLPFSNICPWLENLGMVLMALSALLSARIVTRG